MKIKNKNNIIKIFGIGLFLIATFYFTSSAKANLGTYEVKIHAMPVNISYGNISTISWYSDADFCTSPDGGGNGSTGAFVTPRLYANKTYHVSCHWDDGSARGIDEESSVTVIVDNAPITTNDDMGITNIVTEDATEVSDTTAKIWGEMNPSGNGNSALAQAYFRYSPLETHPPIFCNDIFGSRMRATNEIPLWGNTLMKVGTTVTDLLPNTQYFYCIVGSSNSQITYGGVKSFRTNLPPVIDPTNGNQIPNQVLSVTTKNALVVDTTSAYLNGSYNTSYQAKTWFEYRKTGIQKENPNKQNNVAIKLLKKVFNIKEAVAVGTSNNYPWNKIDTRDHNAGTNGNMSYLLKNLSPSTSYQFRAAIKADIGNGSMPTGHGNTEDSGVVYGAISSFTTKSSNTVTQGDPNNNGVGYEDPCNNPIHDINCNGTGGQGGGTTLENNLLVFPDLTAGPVSPTNAVVNTSTNLLATVFNRGQKSTEKKFFSFFQISTVYQSNSTTNQNTNNPNIPVNQNNTPVNNNTNQLNNTSYLDKYFLNIFETKNALAAADQAPSSSQNTPSNTSNTIVNLSAVSVPTIPGRGSSVINSFITFPSIGTYYVRACADKSKVTDIIGLIKESNEGNNCGPWTPIIISNTISSNLCTDLSATNYREALPCRYDDALGDYENSPWNNYYNNNNSGNNNSSGGSLFLGQNVTPPNDAIVRYHEGIEHVFVRQILANTAIANMYGYKQGDDLNSFAWNLADRLAKTFGYIDNNRKEIRVSMPDIAAYQLRIEGAQLIVYEYFDSKIVNIESTTMTLRDIYEYEYYFHK